MFSLEEEEEKEEKDEKRERERKEAKWLFEIRVIIASDADFEQISFP